MKPALPGPDSRGFRHDPPSLSLTCIRDTAFLDFQGVALLADIEALCHAEQVGHARGFMNVTAE